MTCFRTPLRSPLRPQGGGGGRERLNCTEKTNQKTPKTRQGLPKPEQQTREDRPHPGAAQWAVVRIDWVEFQFSEGLLSATAGQTNKRNEHLLNTKCGNGRRVTSHAKAGRVKC